MRACDHDTVGAMTENSATTPSAAPGGIAAGYVTAIDHVGIAVPDFDAAVQWHRDHLGLVLAHEEINEDQGVREGMLSPAGTAFGVETAVQILAPLSEESTIAKFIDRSGPGLQQLAYRVTDVDALSAELRAAGVRLLYDAPRHGTADSRINFIHPKDAGGVLVELVEPAGASR